MPKACNVFLEIRLQNVFDADGIEHCRLWRCDTDKKNRWGNRFLTAIINSSLVDNQPFNG
jgi:hypothetical protein